MQENAVTEQQSVDRVYNFAANELVHQKRTSEDVIEMLVGQGLDNKSATLVVTNLQEQIKEAKKKRARKDMLYGALWCIGGTVGTLAQTGFIFWGAIVFGGFQFFKGLVNAI
ncbi:MAG: hypothetical protein ABIX01_12720 [Chitinophagaceae bacterium]